jgi:hypothetical protein
METKLNSAYDEVGWLVCVRVSVAGLSTPGLRRGPDTTLLRPLQQHTPSSAPPPNTHPTPTHHHHHHLHNNRSRRC